MLLNEEFESYCFSHLIIHFITKLNRLIINWFHSFITVIVSFN